MVAKKQREESPTQSTAAKVTVLLICCFISSLCAGLMSDIGHQTCLPVSGFLCANLECVMHYQGQGHSPLGPGG